MAFEAIFDERAPSQDPLVVHLHRAARRRLGLLERTDAWRLHDADLDGPGGPAAARGATIECFGSQAVLNTYRRAAYDARHELARALAALGAGAVFLKVRARTDLRRASRTDLYPREPISGDAPEAELVVEEDGMRFGVRLDDGLSTGLFLDQRDNRAQLRADCAGMNVLNLFCYTCSFSIAAGLGGARRVTSVDLAQAALERGDRNLRLNGLSREQHRLLRADARKWLERALRRDERFDRIILDPPSFSNVKGGAFSVDREYAELVRSCVPLLSAGGALLSVLNHRKTSAEQLAALIRSAAAASRRRVSSLRFGAVGCDCVASGFAATKSVWVTMG